MNTLAKLGIIASIIGGMSAIIFLADWYYDIRSNIDKGYELSVNNEKNIKSIEEKLDKLIAGQDSISHQLIKIENHNLVTREILNIPPFIRDTIDLNCYEPWKLEKSKRKKYAPFRPCGS
jgi:hypothetical protein